MADRPSVERSLPFDPVIELLRGGDPEHLARLAGISVEELLKRRDAFLQTQARKAQEEDVVFRKIGRNDPCPCGSGLKYKRCCMRRHQEVVARMDPEEVRKRTERQRENDQREARVKEGYELLTRRDYQKAHAYALRWSNRYPEDDRFHDVMATAAMYLGNLEEAIRVIKSRWGAAQKEKAFFLAHQRHAYDDPDAPLGHAYAPQAWLERYWVALKAEDYRANYPQEPDPQILRWIKELQKADDLQQYPQQREEGLRVRKEALAGPIQSLKDTGVRALPYLLPLCTQYSWTALMIPDILLHWGDDASMHALVEIALFHYPFVSESCLKALEQLGACAMPHLEQAFNEDQTFDLLKIGLISVAGKIGTHEALAWVATLLDHPEPSIVNWAGGVLAEAGYVDALEKIKEANVRIGREPRLEWAIEELSRLRPGATSSAPS